MADGNRGKGGSKRNMKGNRKQQQQEAEVGGWNKAAICKNR